MALNKLTLIACSFLVSLLILTWEIQSIDARPLKSRSKNELQNLPIHTKTHKNKSEDNAGHKRDLHGKSTTEASSVVVSPPPPQSDQVDGAAQLPPPPAHAVDDFRPTAPGHSPGVGHSLQN
ncbi:hypothetical protein D8674_013746 [Pyrus ussuriensis x Pyrus communis]|uniref:Uncharacterized protein n=1 Tax=Pyrus ussuriensis x Pyrus communis TaxID=2448454 RepID=A0A5N5GRU3_9ROSA|nr:hypothetical protein D8674_013746 [Pyrus ussuriensis x Pyrus communis]